LELLTALENNIFAVNAELYSFVYDDRERHLVIEASAQCRAPSERVRNEEQAKG